MNEDKPFRGTLNRAAGAALAIALLAVPACLSKSADEGEGSAGEEVTETTPVHIAPGSGQANAMLDRAQAAGDKLEQRSQETEHALDP